MSESTSNQNTNFPAPIPRMRTAFHGWFLLQHIPKIFYLNYDILRTLRIWIQDKNIFERLSREISRLTKSPYMSYCQQTYHITKRKLPPNPTNLIRGKCWDCTVWLIHALDCIWHYDRIEWQWWQPWTLVTQDTVFGWPSDTMVVTVWHRETVTPLCLVEQVLWSE